MCHLSFFSSPVFLLFDEDLIHPNILNIPLSINPYQYVLRIQSSAVLSNAKKNAIYLHNGTKPKV